MNSSPRKWSIRFLVLALLLTVTAFGQSTTGSISGVVEDGRRTHIVGAAVTITNPENSISRMVTTRSVGSFAVSQLPPGVYTIIIEKEELTQTTRGKLMRKGDRSPYFLVEPHE